MSESIAQLAGPASPNGAASSSPRLRPRRYLGCQAQTRTTPTGLRLGRRTGHNPVGVGGWEHSLPQGSSCLATLGWRPQPRWGCQWRLPLPLAPGFSRVYSAVVSPSRFNGLFGVPLRHGQARKPLKRLRLPVLPNTRLKPGANETGRILDHRPTSPHLLLAGRSSNQPWPLAHGLPATQNRSSHGHLAVALVAGRLAAPAGCRATQAARKLGTRRVQRLVAWPVQWCSCGSFKLFTAIQQDFAASVRAHLNSLPAHRFPSPAQRATDNSPALECWVSVGGEPSPVRDERAVLATLLSSLTGLSGLPIANPALKGWAIFGWPCGPRTPLTHSPLSQSIPHP